MTVIVALKDDKNKIWMAGDRQISTGDTFYETLTPKVIKREGLLLGYAGDCGFAEAVVHDMTLPKKIRNSRLYMVELFYSSIKKTMNRKGFEEDDVSILIGINHRLFECQASKGKIYIGEVPTPYAIGSGSDIALGSILAHQEFNEYLSHDETMILEQAIKNTAKINRTVNSTVDIIHE